MIPSPALHLCGLAGALRLGTGPAPAPAPSPAPALKIIFEGDSIKASTSPNSMANQWLAANPAVASANLAQAGARLNNGANSLNGRLSALVSASAGFTVVHPILIGANDLYDTTLFPTVADWQNALAAHIANVRAAVPGIKIGVGTLLPASEDTVTLYQRPGHNARRAVVNPWLRGLVGTTIDFLIPYGEHPEMTDAAATGSAFIDGLHPTAGTYGFLLETLNAVLNPIVASAAGAAPSAFTFSDFATATASTIYTERNTVTGMGMGQSATASVTGAGDYARGTLPAGLSYGTAAQAIMNGDILTSRVTSSASATTLVQHILNMGATSDTWDITTAANPAVTVFSTTYKHASATLQTARQCYGDDAINAPQCVFADSGRATGKHYFEMTFYTAPIAGGAGVFQVAVGGPSNATANMPGQLDNVPGATYRQGGTVRHLTGVTATTVTAMPTFGIADTIGVCIDADADKVWFLKNGVSISGDPAAGTGGFPLNPTTIASWWPAAVPQREDGHKLNCGQDPFNFTPPTGFAAYG